MIIVKYTIIFSMQLISQSAELYCVLFGHLISFLFVWAFNQFFFVWAFNLFFCLGIKSVLVKILLENIYVITITVTKCFKKIPGYKLLLNPSCRNLAVNINFMILHTNILTSCYAFSDKIFVNISTLNSSLYQCMLYVLAKCKLSSNLSCIV